MRSYGNSILLYNSLKKLHLLGKTNKITVVRDLLGLQAQFANNPKISLKLRSNDYSEDDWNENLIKIWSQRSTIHVVLKEEAGLYLSAHNNYGSYEDNYWGINKDDAEKWSQFILEEIKKGNNSRDGIKEACIEAGMSNCLFSLVFNGWGGLIKEMACRGKIYCDPGTEKKYHLLNKVEFVDVNFARKEMIRRYFTVYGPATLSDCRYFFNDWSKRDMTTLLKEVLSELNIVHIDGIAYYYLGEYEESINIPDCILIPGFDSLILGYQNRDRMMDRVHFRKVTNMAGIVFPTILLRKRIRARWKISGKKILITPFEELCKKDIKNIDRVIKKEFGKEIKIEYLPVLE